MNEKEDFDDYSVRVAGHNNGLCSATFFVDKFRAKCLAPLSIFTIMLRNLQKLQDWEW